MYSKIQTFEPNTRRLIDASSYKRLRNNVSQNMTIP